MKRNAAEWAYGGMTRGATTLLASSRHFSDTRGNTRIPYSWNDPLVPDYKNILHCHGISDKVLCSKILSNILYPIEYSYDSTGVPTGYPTFSIAYLIYSTHHNGLLVGLPAYSAYRRWIPPLPALSILWSYCFCSKRAYFKQSLTYTVLILLAE